MLGFYKRGGRYTSTHRRARPPTRDPHGTPAYRRQSPIILHALTHTHSTILLFKSDQRRRPSPSCSTLVQEVGSPRGDGRGHLAFHGTQRAHARSPLTRRSSQLCACAQQFNSVRQQVRPAAVVITLLSIAFSITIFKTATMARTTVMLSHDPQHAAPEESTHITRQFIW